MTAPVAPMEARCAVCLDTGSLSQHMDGFLDCRHCDAVEKRLAMREHLAQFTAWPNSDTAAWAAYLFAQRQAAPVAPQPNKNALADEVIAALDALQVGCTEQSWVGWQNGNGEEVGARLEAAITAYRTTQPSDKAASFWSEVEARNHEVRPAQQVEAVGPSIQALARIGEVLGTDEDEGGPLPIIEAIEAMQKREKSVADLMRDWKTRATSSDDVCVALFGLFSSTPAIPAVPQLEAQQAGDVTLSEQAVLDMLREKPLFSAKGLSLAMKGDFFSLNLTEVTAIVNCAIAQGRKA